MMRRSSSVSLPGLVSTSIGMRILPMSCSRPATPIARTCRFGTPSDCGQRHRQHRDVERVRRRVLIELLQLQQRQHHAPVGRASPPTATARPPRPPSAARRPGRGSRPAASGRSRPRRRASGRACVSAAAPASACPCEPHRAEADAERPHLAAARRCPPATALRRAKSSCEELVELVARHARARTRAAGCRPPPGAPPSPSLSDRAGDRGRRRPRLRGT